MMQVYKIGMTKRFNHVSSQLEALQPCCSTSPHSVQFFSLHFSVITGLENLNNTKFIENQNPVYDFAGICIIAHQKLAKMVHEICKS